MTQTHTHTKSLTPKLRFPEFTEDIRKTSLNDIATFSKGKNISKSDIVEDGKVECIRYGELYTDYGEVIEKIISKTNLPKTDLIFSKVNDIIIPSSGETQLDIATASCVLKSDVALGGDLNIIRTKQNGIFISYYLNNAKKRKIASLAQGNSVVHLYNNQLASLYLNLPRENEQQKIASFLSEVDKKLNLLQQKKNLLEDYKKGVMQQIFSQEIRFKHKEGGTYPEWEEKKLGEIFKFKQGFQFGVNDQSETSFEGSVEFIRIINVTSNVNDKRYVIDPGKEHHINKNDLFMVRYGDAGRIVKGYTGIIANNMFRLLPKIGMNKTFFFYNVGRLYNKIHSLSGSSTMPAISFSVIDKLKVRIPCTEEQTQIANFLSAIDEKIQLVSSQIEQTQQFKKGLLQQLFV